MSQKRAKAAPVPVTSTLKARGRLNAPASARRVQHIGNLTLGKILSHSATSFGGLPLASDTSQKTGSWLFSRLGFSGFPLQRKCASCERETSNINFAVDKVFPQRTCACAEEDKEHVQRKADGEDLGTSRDNVREALHSPSRRLDKSTRESMESRFGHDFSRVEVHLDSTAAKSAKALNAHAYTVGEHVVFAPGRYAPNTEAGRGLIAHELTHVVQQQNGLRTASGAVGDQAEREALDNERMIHTGGPLRFSAAPPVLARRDDGPQKSEMKAPTGPPGCTAQHSEKIDPAARLAIQWLDRSIGQLSRFVSAPVNKENQQTGQVLQKHFGTADPAIVKRVLDRVTIIRHDIDAARRGNQLSTQCQDDKDPTCQYADAYVTGDRDSLVFCPKFFKHDLESRAETIVHEMAHSILEDITDRGYAADRILKPVDGHHILSTAEQLTNAESYALLVQELGTGKAPKSTAVDDSFARSCREIEPLLKVAIARGQRWNRSAETRINTMEAGPVLQKQFGADTPQIRKAAYDFYHRASQNLYQSFSFKCEKECGGARVAYGKPAADNLLKGLGIGTGLGAGIGTIVGAIAGAFLGAAGAGALLGLAIGTGIGYFAGLITGFVTSHGPQIHVCPRWKDQQDETARIESILAAAYEALGNSSADSLKYAQLARGFYDLFPIPSLEQIDRDVLQRRLTQVRQRLERLRKQYRESTEAFVQSLTQERLRESVARGTQELRKEIRSDSANPDLWGGSFAGKSIRKAVTVAASGTTANVAANFQITYLTLSDREAQERAKQDIPRIEQAVSSVWQVDIASGEYAGVAFRLVPSVKLLKRGAQRAPNAFLIQVRGADKEPSSGDSVHGLISLAKAHLQGPRVIVIAHELAHLFGFVDTYATRTTREKGGKTSEKMIVGRSDRANRPDLLGMIDPVILERERKKGSVTPEEAARQTGTIRVWEEEASTVLRTLGVPPPERPRPTPESEDFDPQVELDRIKREGESKLEQIRKRRQKIDEDVKSVQLAEEIIQLEAEEKDLNAQLSKP